MSNTTFFTAVIAGETAERVGAGKDSRGHRHAHLSIKEGGSNTGFLPDVSATPTSSTLGIPSSVDLPVPLQVTVTEFAGPSSGTQLAASTVASGEQLSTSTAVSISGAQRAAASSSEQLSTFTTVSTLFSAEVFTSTSGTFKTTFTSSVPVLTSTITGTTPVPTSTIIKDQPAKSQPAAGFIGGIVAAALIVLLAGGICTVLFIRRRRRNSRRIDLEIMPLEDPSTEKRRIIQQDLDAGTNEPNLNPFQTPSERSFSGIRTERQMRPQTEVDDVRSQMASLQDSNEEMRATMNRMMVHVRRLEAHIEADMAEERSDAPPPTYVST